MYRRILGLGDSGDDVLLVQEALNDRLPVQPQLPPVIEDWRVFGKRYSPTAWGYVWAPGGYAKAHL